MDGSNWRPSGQIQPQTEPQAPPSSMDAGDWRTQLQPDSRQRIVNKIMDTLKRHLPVSGQEGLHELQKIAVRFEEKIYSAASSQSDYLRRISLKMLTMETKSQNPTMSNPIQSNQLGVGKNPSDPGAQVMPPPLANNQTQSLSNQLANNQSQSRPPLLSQNIQNNITAGVQSSAGLPSSILPVSGLTQSPLQNSNMQNISGISQNSIGNSMGQGGPSNMFSGSQRPVQGRQLPQQVSSQQHQQQQSQNSQHYHFQQQLQQQLLKPKFPQGNANHPLMQSHIQKQQQQQQQQQNHLQPNQLQSSQQSLQPSMMQSAPLSNLQQNQQSSVQQSTQSVIQQHQQAVLRQQQQPQQVPIMHQQQTPVAQSSLLPSQQQQQQQLIGQQPNATIMQQNPLIVQQNNVSDMQPQQQQQQQRLLGQQSNISNLQQQQLMAQQNNLSIGHQQQLVSQSNVSGVQQQQQLIGNQSGNSMQISHHSSHVLHQSKVPMQQQTQHGTSTLLPTQGQQSQAQPQLMSHIQTQPGQIQQQMNMQQQPPNLLQRDIQQRLQTPGVLAQTQNVVDQQKQLFQSQRAAQEAPATSLDSTAHTVNVNGSDWQEEVYQKIKTMKEMYLSELTEIYQKISAKLQQQESLPQQPKQIDRFRIYKNMLEHLSHFLQLPKSNVTPSLKEKLGFYEKQIVTLLQTNNRPRKPVPLQQGQIPSSLTMQQAQQPQSQITQVQPHENQMNPHLQSMSSQMPQNNATILQPGMASLSSGPPGQQSMLTSFQVGHNLDSGQGNAPGSLQQVSVDSLQQNSVSAQQSNINVLTSQSGVNVLPSNMNPLQSNANMLQHQQLKQHPDQQMTPQVKQQFQQQRQIQLMQKQMLQQQQQQQQQQQPPLSQQPKQQQPSQMQAPQMPQLHQMNDANDLKLRQGMGVKQGIFQQHHSASQRPAYHHQQLKVAPFPISSPQLIQAVSPQIPQHSSPQMDQQGLLTSFPKTGTPLQPANSPFAPSPSTPLAPSPVPGEPEKPNSGVSTLSNVVNLVNQQTTGPAAPSLAIGTPGISASPLLAEFTSPDGNHGVVVTAAPEKSSVTQQPLERLIQVVKSMSPKALNASVNDIGSVVSMIDRIAGSAPGNGSRAAVGEDLVAMTKSRLHARNIASQDGISGTKKMRRYTSAMPLNVGSSASSVNDSFKNLVCSETSDLESTATSNIKQPKFEANRALLEEIRMINQCLIDTVVGVSDETASAVVTAEGAVGTIVNCSFTAVALSPNLKSQYASSQMSLIQPLRLLVPANYPNCSPILLDKVPVEVSREHEDLSAKAKSRFSISLRSLSQPTSLGEIAKTWDVCARAIISEYAQQSGGGSFSSKYGTWENCLSAA